MRFRSIFLATLAAIGGLVLLGISVSAAPPPHASPSGAPAGPAAAVESNHGNAGTVKIQPLSDPRTGPDNDPHVGCSGFNIVGSGLSEPSGPYQVVSSAPTGNGSVVSRGTWTYDGKTGGWQVIAGPITTLSAGHYRLDMTQDPAKHKMFWVDSCSTGGGVGSARAPSRTTTPSNGERPASTSTATGSVLGATAALPTASVSAAAGTVLAATGTPVGLVILGIVLLIVGAVVTVGSRRLSSS